MVLEIGPYFFNKKWFYQSLVFQSFLVISLSPLLWLPTFTKPHSCNMWHFTTAKGTLECSDDSPKWFNPARIYNCKRGKGRVGDTCSRHPCHWYSSPSSTPPTDDCFGILVESLNFCSSANHPFVPPPLTRQSLSAPFIQVFTSTSFLMHVTEVTKWQFTSGIHDCRRM